MVGKAASIRTDEREVVMSEQPGPDEGYPEPVGTSDAEADAVRSGAKDDLGDLETDQRRDTDNVAVGREDAEEDARASGADPDAV